MRVLRSLLLLLAALGLLARPSLQPLEHSLEEGHPKWRSGRAVDVAVALEERCDVLPTRPGDDPEPGAQPVGGMAGCAAPPATFGNVLPPRTPGARAEPEFAERAVLARAFLRVDGSSNALGARA